MRITTPIAASNLVEDNIKWILYTCSNVRTPFEVMVHQHLLIAYYDYSKYSSRLFGRITSSLLKTRTVVPDLNPLIWFTREFTTTHTWGISTRRAGKLWKARSRLYRSRFLQPNTRWKALAEIYTIHSFAPLSNLIFPQTFNKFIDMLLILPKFCEKIQKFR